MRRIKIATGVLLLSALALHTYTHAVLASAFHPGFWLWSLAPYAIVAAMLWRGRFPCATLGAVLLPILGDLATHYSVFYAATSSTAALGLVAMPLWNLLLFLPVGGASGWLVDRRVRQADSGLTGHPKELP